MKSNVTLKGTPVTLAGKFITAGEKAPDFTLVQENLHDFSLIIEKHKRFDVAPQIYISLR